MKPFTIAYSSHSMTDKQLEVLDRVNEHLIESLEYFNQNQIAFIALQGSQNYGLETETSDVDTKLILLPSLNNLVFNHQAISTTHVRANNEHTDWKDLRLMFQTFRKQNLNFVEVLYSPWIITNQDYVEELRPLFENRDLIGHYCPTKAVQTMKGIAMTKYQAMEKQTPAHAADMEKYGYCPKELHHLMRITTFMKAYINGCDYATCLQPSNTGYLKFVKQGGLNLDEARKLADIYFTEVTTICDNYINTHEMVYLPEGEELLNDVQSDVMKKAIRKELEA